MKEIVDKYDNQLPRVISNQKMNEYIKVVAKLAQLDDRISVSITKGGAKQTEVLEKHKLVTVHTARRSFATNMYLMDIPPISIMKITGHRSERAFLLYIRILSRRKCDKTA